MIPKQMRNQIACGATHYQQAKDVTGNNKKDACEPHQYIKRQFRTALCNKGTSPGNGEHYRTDRGDNDWRRGDANEGKEVLPIKTNSPINQVSGPELRER